MPVELLVATTIKALLELASLCLLGQGLLYLLVGQRRDSNLFYQVLKLLGSPPVRLVRLITPASFPPLWVACIALSMMAAAWVVATYYKICLTIGTC